MQFPDATQVASYSKWKQLHRYIKRGEKGIKILCPSPKYGYIDKIKTDPITQQPIIGPDGKPITEKEKIVERINFYVGYVFDISQTGGEALPEIGVHELYGKVENYSFLFTALQKVSPFPISFENILSTAKGYCDYVNGKIVIRPEMSEVQNIKTAVHEIAHGTMHNYYNNKTTKKSREIREVEAESVAYVVCQYYNIDTSSYSFPYIASWSQSNIDIFKESLSVIKHQSDILINKIDDMILLQTNKLNPTIKFEETPSKTTATYDNNISNSTTTSIYPSKENQWLNIPVTAISSTGRKPHIHSSAKKKIPTHKNPTI